MRHLPTAFIATLCLGLTGCGYNTIQTQDEAVKGRLVRGRQPVPAARGPHSEPREHGQGFRRPGTGGADRRDRSARPRDVHPGDAGTPQRSRGTAEIPGGPGRADRCAEKPARRRREVPGPEVGPELPRPAGAARGHREPHRGGAQPLHRGRADLQRDDPALPRQPDRDDLQLRREAEPSRSRTKRPSRSRRPWTSPRRPPSPRPEGDGHLYRPRVH